MSPLEGTDVTRVDLASDAVGGDERISQQVKGTQ